MCYRRIVEQSNTVSEAGAGSDAEADSSGEKAAAIPLRTVSTVEAATEALREMILGGQLETGARLRETEFSERLGVARHTFRAATQTLITGLSSRIGERFEAIVTGAASKGTFVRLVHPPAEGRVVRGAEGLDVGDKVVVELVDTAPARGFIDFACVEGPKASRPPPAR